MNKQTKWLTAAAVAASFSLALTACGGSTPSEGGGDEAPRTIEGADYNPVDRADMQQGGTVVRAIGEISPQMNAMHSDGQVDTQTVWTWYNPQIILSTPEGEAYPNPAYVSEKTVEEVDGNTVLTLTFTDEAEFNDGTPMDWKTIENTWIANNGEGDYVPNSTEGYRNIASVEAGETEKQAVVTFDGTFAWVDALFFNVVHPAVDTAEKFNEAYLEEAHPEWGAGPYTIKEFDKNGRVITFEPNENWWGDEPMLDEMTFREMDETAAMNAFRNGEIDMVGTGTADRMQQIADMDGVTTYRAARAATNLIELNAEREQFADLETRQALLMAINREQITEVMWDGLDYTEDPAGSLNLYPYQEGYEDALANAGWEFNVDEANAILDEAGWAMGDDGVRERDGVRFEGRLPSFGDDPITEARGRVVQQQLAEVGFELELDQRAPSEFSTTLSEKDWDLVMLGFSSSDAYGVMWMCQLYCEGSGLNLSATMDSSFDDRIHEVEALATPEEQIPAAMELEADLIAESWGILPLYSGPSIMTVKDGLANLTPEPYTGLDLFGIQPVENFGWAAE
ncbi:ABC transporter family substrate-binding protein [Microbacterium karelineae]|uniref:ABC transporter family substrate-binding protein n=1 Tax=Microbacterium karelineae TaxID=2654283 RepID=UPI0018D382B9|nr:ABC transporter family substrate-binding protein [Microbacterium karelineae]